MKTSNPSVSATKITETNLTCLADVVPNARLAIKVSRSGIEFDGHGYFIEWDRLDSREKLLEWIHHLSEKTWVDSRMIGDLIERVHEHFGWKVHVNA